MHNKYLLNFTDHFSKYSKCYLIDNKKTETVIEKFQDYFNVIGNPEIIHTDNGGEFSSKLFTEFCEKNKIKIIHGGVKHPQSQGAVEKFNNTIINKIQYIKIEEKKKFNIINALNKPVDIYNRTTHSRTHIEPFKAFKFIKKKDLNRVLHNIIKSQINENKDNIIVKKGSKALLCSNFVLTGNILNEKIFSKKNMKFLL